MASLNAVFADMQSKSVKHFKFEGYDVKLPKLQDRKDPFLCPPFYFVQPSWIRDEDATTCLKCQERFTHIRRRHHCRHCGNIFCSKCCNNKVSLPQFQLHEPQKVCMYCCQIAHLVAMCYSENENERHAAAFKLGDSVGTVAEVVQMIEAGGIQLLISFFEQEDIALKSSAAKAFHTLSQYLSLHPLLIEVGIVKVISNTLNTFCDHQQILIDSLGTLSFLCQTAELKAFVLKDGILEPLLAVLEKSEIVALLAGKILQQLVNNPDAFGLLVQKGSVLIPRILAALKTSDAQMQNLLLKILVYLSAGSENNRHWIIQEEEALGNPILNLLTDVNFENSQLAVNSVCVVANLATSAYDQSSLQPYISALCKLLDQVPETFPDLIVHIGRGLANFAEFPANSLLLLQWLPSVISILLKSENELHHLHASRLIVSLISSEPTSTLHILNNEGILPFMETLFSLPGVNELLINTILRKASRLSMGLS